MYLRESPICKGEVGVLVCVESLQALFYEVNIGLYNLCETASLITYYSSSGVKSFFLSVIVSFFVHIEAKEKLNVEYLEIDNALL